jgi:hypothetical protein
MLLEPAPYASILTINMYVLILLVNMYGFILINMYMVHIYS